MTKGRKEPENGSRGDRLSDVVHGMEALMAEMAGRQVTMADFDAKMSTLEDQVNVESAEALWTKRYAKLIAMLAAIELGGTVAEVEHRFLTATQLGFADVEQRAYVVMGFGRFGAKLGNSTALQALLSLRDDLLAIPTSIRTRMEKTVLRSATSLLRDIQGAPPERVMRHARKENRAGFRGVEPGVDEMELARLGALMKETEAVLVDIGYRRVTLADVETRVSNLEVNAVSPPASERLANEVARHISKIRLLAGIALGATLRDVEDRYRSAKALGFGDVGHRAFVVLTFAQFAAPLGSTMAADELSEFYRELARVPAKARTPGERQAHGDARALLEDLADWPLFQPSDGTGKPPSGAAG